jgi:hypothetical protein
MELEVAGCVTRRLKYVIVRGELDQDSARWLCGRANDGALPRQAGTLRAAV